jgi:hypothetical protein
MNDLLHKRLIEAIHFCVAPLARMLLRAGISYRQFSEAAKMAFVQEAMRDPHNKSKALNTSRIAARTGLSRKEVARIREVLESKQTLLQEFYGDNSSCGNAVRVLQLWYSHPTFLTEAGEPLDLPMDGPSPSFTALVKLCGGDVPAGAIRAELLQAGAAEETPDGQLRVLKRCYIPSDSVEDMVVGMTYILRPAFEVLAENCNRPPQERYFQRVAYSDRVRKQAVTTVRQRAELRLAAVLQAMDDLLTEHEVGPDEPVEEGKWVGVGLYYYEGDPPPSSKLEKSK